MKIGFVGETNAGKSTLFNRFFGSFRAIVSDISWTTRENIVEKIKWDDEWNYAEIYDSPGIDKFDEEFEYIKKIIDEVDIPVLVVDGTWSPTENINRILNYIRKKWKEDKTILAVNKIDTTSPTKINLALAPWYELGLENIIPISAKNNFNLVELKEKIEELRKKHNIPLISEKENKKIPFTLVWRINVGKSTLFNSIVWKDFSKVSPEWWTTLDYLTYPIKYNWKEYEIIDTAGFRRKWKIHWLEKIATADKFETMLKLKKPILVVLFDISEWVTHRDMTLLGEMLEKNLPIIVAFNKIDDVDEFTLKKYKQDLKRWMKFAPWIPLVYISGKEKKWLKDLFKMLDLVAQQRKIQIATSELNNLIQQAFISNPPKFPKNKSVKVKYITQDKENPSRFIVFVNKKENINFAFKKWLENIIRKNYWFFGVPLTFEFRENKKWEEHIKSE